MSPPLISFVIPCYNYGRFLGDCLKGIFNQEGGSNFEIILVDDASTDNTHEVLRSFSDPRLCIIHHPENRGHITTVNEGLAKAQGVFIARIDPDDRYRPYFLRATLEKFEEFPEVGLVYGDAALMNEDGKVTQEHCNQTHASHDFKGNEFIRLLEKNFICSPTVIARREAWLRAYPAPVSAIVDDWYFTLMMAREYDFYYINQVLAEYRVHPSNHHSSIIRNKSEELSVFKLLDQIFSEQEKSVELEKQKQNAKNRIYGTQFLDIANKYFGFRMNQDARRCYFQTLRWRSSYLLRPDVMRRLAATLINRNLYERCKTLARPVKSNQ